MIPGYQIIEEIGKGGMANVYKARAHNGTIVAIKLLNESYKDDEAVKQRFENEALAMKILDHPNIVKVYNYISFENTSAIIMELLEGQTLSGLVRKNGALNKGTAISIMQQTLSAIDYAHKNGIIHRDIKPSNIFITKNNIVKVIDFGIAKFAGSQQLSVTKTKSVIGTVLYMSPEQIRSAKKIDNLTDIYSLGVLLYYMLSGKQPYNINELSEFDIQEKIVKEPFPKLFQYPNIDKIIEKATQKKPENRFLSCESFYKSLIHSKPENNQNTLPNVNNKPVEILIGRSYEAYIRVNTPYVSRQHAILYIDVHNQIYKIKDLNSTSGTYINNTRIHNTAILKKGDIVYLGNFRLNWEQLVIQIAKNQNIIIDDSADLNSGTTRKYIYKSNYIKTLKKYTNSIINQFNKNRIKK